MKLLFFFFMLCIAICLFSTGCTVKKHIMEYPSKTEIVQDTQTTGKPMMNDKPMTVEEMTREAHSLYQSALKDSKSKEQAVNKAAEFLRAQKNVSLVIVTGSDTIKVIFTDGNDLLMFLGRERL